MTNTKTINVYTLAKLILQDTKQSIKGDNVHTFAKTVLSNIDAYIGYAQTRNLIK